MGIDPGAEQQFIIRFVDGRFMAGRSPTGAVYRIRTLSSAKTFPTRWAALEECAKGPAAVFEGSAIVPWNPEDALEASGRPNGSTKGQKRRGGA